MTFTRADIIDDIHNQIGFPRNRSREMVDFLLETIKKELQSGEDVMVSGFGKFCVKEKKKRKGRNPATGGDLMLDARKVVTFKYSGRLRDRINGKTK